MHQQASQTNLGTALDIMNTRFEFNKRSVDAENRIMRVLD